MRIMVAAGLAVLVVGCSHGAGTRIQAECESRFTQFVDLFQCTRGAIASEHPERLQDARSKMYLLRGEQLAGEVASGRKSNVEAKVEWQRLYIDLWGTGQIDRAAAAAALQSPPIEQGYQIVQPPKVTRCTTRNVLGSMQTDCNSQ